MQAEQVTTRRRNVIRVVKFTDFHDLSQSVRLFLGLASARRDSSFKLLSTAIQVCAKTQEALDNLGRGNATTRRLSESVSALREVLTRFEERDFDGDDVLKEKDLETLAGTLIDSFKAILTVLDSAMTTGALVPGLSKRLLISLARLRPLMVEKQQVITSSVSQLISLLFLVHVRRAIKEFQTPLVVPTYYELPDDLGYREYKDIIRASGQSTDLSSDYKSEDIWSLPIGCSGIGHETATLPSPYVPLKPPRPCLMIMFFFATFVALSCFLGIYFTLNKSYGYSMGDAFTLAGWVVSVGAFVSTAILAYHYPRCECWGPSKNPQRSRRGSYEMVNLAELPG